MEWTPQEVAIMADAKYGTLWSRDELILALYLYCRKPSAEFS